MLDESTCSTCDVIHNQYNYLSQEKFSFKQQVCKVLLQICPVVDVGQKISSNGLFKCFCGLH